ncbi:MAG: FAD:protein FMN transferase [Thermoguttaceae bacterium]|jgi:thiamine biosynthesis lipoprotein|nr:FAD:protein FMN transferase [Thermoguttaceae bacterium]
MARRSTRRDFLKGKAAANAMADAAAGPLSAAGDRTGRAGAGYVVRLSRRAMACDFEVFLNVGQYPEGTEAALHALDLLEPLEEQLSVFRLGSEIATINRIAAAQPVEVESRLFELLELAGRLHHQTNKAFDVTSAPLSEAWGFAGREAHVPGEAELQAAMALVGWQWIELDPRQRTVRLLKEGVRINLGSIGKGYALDRCAEELAAAGVHDFLLHAGGSSIVARGDCIADPPGWIVGIPHPLRPDRRLAELRLKNRALATSGSRFQSFMHEGRRLSHVLDPRTGWPAEGVLTATAIAFDAATADALSTAFFVLGPEGTQQFCEDHPDVAAVLCTPATGQGGYHLHQFGLNDTSLRLL